MAGAAGSSSPSSGSAPPADDARARLLAAAIRIYAQHGYQGATTRLIAAEAGVNEVTLFRLFGAKEALLDDAIACSAEPRAATPLRLDAPRAPLRELTAWCRAEIVRLGAARALIRKCFADADDHPRHVRHTVQALDGAAAELRTYADAIIRAGRARVATTQRDAAVAMLLSTLVTDALARGEMAGVFRGASDEAPRRYAAIFLGAIGCGKRASADGEAQGGD